MSTIKVTNIQNPSSGTDDIQIAANGDVTIGGLSLDATAAAGSVNLDSSGRLLVGTSTARSNFYNGTGISSTVQFETTHAAPGSQGRFILSNNTSGSQAFEQIFLKSGAATTGSYGLVSNNDRLGLISFQGTDGSEGVAAASIECYVDGTPGANDMPGRLVFSTTADGASSPTERLRIRSDGYVNAGGFTGSGFHRFNGIDDVEGDPIFLVSGYQNSGGSNQDTAIFYGVSSSANPNGAGAAFKAWRHSSTNRSINAAGTINASGADYAEYMVKAGDFTIAKGSIAGVNAEGRLTNVFSDAISFVVKSTDPSCVGGDTWHLNVGEEPGGYNDDRTEEEIEAAKIVYKQQLEDARQKVDRIAFAGQVPVNVVGATPGQYIVPIENNGGIIGIAKDEADLTLAEYMQAVGKVIAIEDDGRARIIVKVA